MFTCLNCNFSCKKKGDWSRHITTKKHLKQHENKDDLKQIIIKQQEQIDLQQKQINELIPKIKNITNNKFNLNIFLNDKCKDALNWSEFINMLHIHENIDITSISELICTELYNIGIYNRPIHCLDIKRKKLCIKNKNVWEHDDSKIINTLTESANMLHDNYLKMWESNHPNWFENEHETDIYTRIVNNLTMEEYTNTISKNICIPKIEM
jgi:hypothetical protein